MKRNFKFAALALAAVALVAACNNNATPEPVDTMPVIDTTVVEQVIE